MTDPNSLHPAADQAPIPADPVIPGFGGEGKSGYITGYKNNGKPHVEIMPHKDALARLARRGVALGAMAIDAEVTPDAAPRQPVTASETWNMLSGFSRLATVNQTDLRQEGSQVSVKPTLRKLGNSWDRESHTSQELEAVVALGAGRALGVVHVTHGNKGKRESTHYLSLLNDKPDSRAVLLGELNPDEPFTVGRDTLERAIGAKETTRYVKAEGHATVSVDAQGVLTVANKSERYDTTVFTAAGMSHSIAEDVWSIPPKDARSLIDARTEVERAAFGQMLDAALARSIAANSTRHPNDPSARQ